MDSFLKLKKGSPVKRTHTSVLASLTGFSHGLDQGGRSSTEPPGPPDRSSDPLKVPGWGGGGKLFTGSPNALFALSPSSRSQKRSTAGRAEEGINH